MAGVVPGLMLAGLLGPDHLVSGAQVQTTASWPRPGGQRVKALRESVACLLIVVVIGGIYSASSPDRSRRHVCAAARTRRGVCLRTGPSSKVPKVLLDSASMGAMLLYIITNAGAVLLPDRQRTSRKHGRLAAGHGSGPDQLPADGEYSAAAGRQFMEPSSIVLILRRFCFRWR